MVEGRYHGERSKPRRWCAKTLSYLCVCVPLSIRACSFSKKEQAQEDMWAHKRVRADRQKGREGESGALTLYSILQLLPSCTHALAANLPAMTHAL